MKTVWIFCGIGYLSIVLWLLPNTDDILIFTGGVTAFAAFIRYVNLDSKRDCYRGGWD